MEDISCMHEARGWRYKTFGLSGTGTGKTMAASAHLARPAIAICTLLTAALTSGMIALATKADDTAAAESDVVVIRGTPGGVATAVVAARLGHSVTLVERSGWMRPDRGGAEELPIDARGRIFLVGSSPPQYGAIDLAGSFVRENQGGSELPLGRE